MAISSNITSDNATSTTPQGNANGFLINYSNRDFESLRQDLINYAETRHGDVFASISESSPDMLYIELLAYIGDTLNFSIDKAFNEGFRETAQSRESLIRIAQDLGFYEFYGRPSSTQAVASITVPAAANSNGSALIPDPNYLLNIYAGMQVQFDNGTIFECLQEINFASDINRVVIPNLDSNNQLINYTIQVSIVLQAGQTKIQRFYVSNTNVQPFMEVLINDTQITQILGVVAVAGNTYQTPDDSAFRDLNNMYLEVENLSQQNVFIPINPLPQNVTQQLVNMYTDMTINYGDWVNKPQRFIVRRTKDGQTYLRFGSTLIDYSTWNSIISSYDIRNLANFSLNQILNNMSLGKVPDPNTTLFIKYRTGSGTSTNVLANQNITILSKQFSTASSTANLSALQQVQSSLSIVSNLPAVGGTNDMTNEEIRNVIGEVFSANDRIVTYEDVKSMIQKMPVEFGRPFRVSYEEIKPQLLNYTQLQNYLNVQLNSLLNLQSVTDRQNQIQTIQQFMSGLPNSLASIQNNGVVTNTLNSASFAITTNASSLWFGEKCRLYVLGIDQDQNPVTVYKDKNGIWQYPNEMMKLNIKNYLTTKRVIGDWIDIVDGRVVNIQIEFTIIANKKNKQKVLIDCLTTLRSYFNITNWQMNQSIIVSNVSTVLQQIDGVAAVTNIKFYNIFGTDSTNNMTYSPQETGMYRNNSSVAVNGYNNKFQMNEINGLIVSYPDTIFSVKYPDIDIIGQTL